MPSPTTRNKQKGTKALIAAALMTVGALAWLASAAKPLPAGSSAPSAKVKSK